MREELITALRDLAATCRDAEEGFGKAAKGTHSDELRARFVSYAGQRATFAETIDNTIRQMGGAPGETGHGSGPLRRGWKELEARIRPKADPEFMAQAADGEESGLKHYDRALAMDFPDDIRAMLERQRDSMQRTVHELRAGQLLGQST
jgi:uncharacterized protein (TIGR02284 family)